MRCESPWKTKHSQKLSSFASLIVFGFAKGKKSGLPTSVTKIRLWIKRFLSESPSVLLRWMRIQGSKGQNIDYFPLSSQVKCQLLLSQTALAAPQTWESAHLAQNWRGSFMRRISEGTFKIQYSAEAQFNNSFIDPSSLKFPWKHVKGEGEELFQRTR